MIDRERMVQALLEMIAIDSPSGDEDLMAEDLIRRLAELGVESSQDDYGNVIGHVAGEGEPVLLSAHMDTVEPGRGIRVVWDGDDILRSDGSTILGADNKAGCAVVLEVVRSVMEDSANHRPIEIAISRDEEMGLVGAANMDYSRIGARVAIVIDSGGPPSSVQGQAPYHYTYDIEVHGRLAHAGLEPEKGIPAISIASEIVAGLPQGRFDAETTGNVGIIRGGTVRNAVPDYCLVQGEMRSMVEEKVETLSLRAQRHIEEVRRRHPEVRIDANFRVAYPGYTLTDDDPAAKLLYAAIRANGLEPDPHPVGGGTDASIFRGQGIAAAVIGRGGYNQHTKEEYLVISEMVLCAKVVESVVCSP